MQTGKEYAIEGVKHALMALGFVFWTALPCFTVFHIMGLV